MTVEEMKNVDIRTVDPETLVDVREIEIDEGLPKEERKREYLRQHEGTVLSCIRKRDRNGFSRAWFLSFLIPRICMIP